MRRLPKPIWWRAFTIMLFKPNAGRGTTVRHIARHYLGLMHGLENARSWRRMLSDAALLKPNRPERFWKRGRKWLRPTV